MDHTANESSVVLPENATGQFCYHLRMAAVFGVAGKAVESASEAVLAWAILATEWPGAHDAALEASRELIGQELAGASDEHRSAAAKRAAAQALDLEGHFVTVGLHREATMYAALADRLDTVVASLANDSV